MNKTNSESAPTWEEFQKKAGKSLEENEEAKYIYNQLLHFHHQKMVNADFFNWYTKVDWNKPFDTNLLKAYEISKDTWKVNFCLLPITEEKAKCLINQWYGFEVGRIKLIGVPCYDATDFHFIRFDCAGMQWLMMDDELYPVLD